MQQIEPTRKPTPENTPLPGGGRWAWSDEAPHWWRLPEHNEAADVAAPDQTPQPE